MKRWVLFLFFFIPLFLFSQENPEGTAGTETESTETQAESAGAAENEAAAEAVDRTVSNPAYVLDRDIATSTQEELSDWCRSLGLNGEGTKEILAERLREYYRLEKIPVLEEPAGTEENRSLIITIENARSTEYFTVESVKEDYVRLRGGVSITLKDSEILHRVKAEEILYNRTRKLLTASGSVVYVKEEGDTVETFRGDGITVNLDNWSTAFMKGVTDHEMSEGETRYRFSGEVISRSGESSTVMRRAEITNAGDEESYWSIRASRLWLLPGSDWAVVNAVIKVGEIPVLYLPAFYYPGNEIIFHPVLGFRTREGTYVQTTTYILGRPKAAAAAEESSITAIMGSGEGMEKVREGVFLRTTGRKLRDQSEPHLSFMADAYVNLGYFIGSELTLPAKEPFGELLFSAGLGFSRDITEDTYGNYTPFPNYDGTSHWHRSNFFDNSVPFRYRFISSGSVGGSGTLVRNAALSWSLPFYSDPYVDNDFMNRSEDSSLFSLIKGATSSETTINDTYLDSYTWQLNGSLSFSTAGLEPYINDLSLTSAAMAVTFGARNTTPQPSSTLSYPPNSRFFYPEKFTLFSVSASVGGTLLTLGERNWTTEGEEADIAGWGKPVSPWDREDSSRTSQAPDLVLPSLTRTVQAPVLEGHRFTLDYRLTPTASSELKFNADNYNDLWQQPEDIDWKDLEYQLYSVRADGSVGLTLSENRNIYTHSVRLYGTASWQDYSYMNERASAFDTQTKRDDAKRQIHNMTYFSNAAEYDFTLTPFYKSEIWQTSNFRYTLKGLVVSGRYENDVWQVRGGKWDRNDLEFHRLQANFNANVFDQMQTLSITADIPPKESAVAGDATARVWIFETNAHSRVRNVTDDPVFEPVYLTETLRFTDRFSLVQYMTYEPEKYAWTTFNTSLTWGGLTATFTAGRSRGWYLVTRDDYITNPLLHPGGFGWYQETEERLNPQELKVGYKKTHSINDGGKVSFEGSVDTEISFNLQQHTYSKFVFILSLTARVNRFLDITLNSRSENDVIFRYFQNTPLFGYSDVDVPGEKNPFIDLVDSFRFDDVSKRTSSGFKLKTFGFNLVHHLGDWDATLGITIFPELNDKVSPPKYRFINQISFVVQWKPVREFKTDLSYDTKEGFNLE